jgi:hypothetical protein
MRSPESNKAMTDRFDVLAWARRRMKDENPDVHGQKTIKMDDVFTYLKKLLMENGVIMYIDLKRSKDPNIIDLR